MKFSFAKGERISDIGTYIECFSLDLITCTIGLLNEWRTSHLLSIFILSLNIVKMA